MARLSVMARLFKPLMVFSILASPFALENPVAYAQCGWFDITCSPDRWNRPPITFPGGSSGESESCLAVMSSPQEYKWSMRNDTTYRLSFHLSGKNYSIDADESIYFTSKVGKQCTSSCSCSATYSEPIIEFDRVADDGQYTARKVKVEVTVFKAFHFMKQRDNIYFAPIEQR
jgi:hypothetical protein